MAQATSGVPRPMVEDMTLEDVYALFNDYMFRPQSDHRNDRLDKPANQKCKLCDGSICCDYQGQRHSIAPTTV